MAVYVGQRSTFWQQGQIWVTKKDNKGHNFYPVWQGNEKFQATCALGLLQDSVILCLKSGQNYSLSVLKKI